VREPPADPAVRFGALFCAHSRPLLAYALRRVDRPQDAADVVAETMLVAWRRLDDVPADDEARPWLFGVARMTLLNHRRAERRAVRLGERLKAVLVDVSLADPAATAGNEGLVHAALAKLGDEDREILRLTAWEGLDPSEIAIAVCQPAATVRTRLHRARLRLRRQLELDGWNDERSGPSGHVPPDGHPLVGEIGGQT
jgi:RNA polymerase sigma factor (sigma-70 family)